MSFIHPNIGFMQGRLSPPIGDLIQAFPWNNWEEEFKTSARINIGLIEWTIDQDRFYENPILTSNGQQVIKDLIHTYSVYIPSITGDFLMQAPFWRFEGDKRTQHLDQIVNLIEAANKVGVYTLVYPLVDNSSLFTHSDNSIFFDNIISLSAALKKYNMRIAFEVDFNPSMVLDFISQFPCDLFGINYDIGNSASLGYDPDEEFTKYAKYIVNVHVKDRLYKGTTVPLGKGSAQIPYVFSLLQSIQYNGNYILQTARAKDSDHVGVIEQYSKYLTSLIEKCALE